MELPEEQVGWFNPWKVQALVQWFFGEDKMRSEEYRLWWSKDEEARKREPLEDQIRRALDEGREIVLRTVDVSESRIPA